jgi:hypothetical protein
MYSSVECAFSGAFVLAGGLSVVVWILIRALSMNLQICWDIVPGTRFFYTSQALGWGVSAALFALTMSLTGVSFRMGDTCHINHQHAMEVFWGPLLFMAGAAGLLQLGTFIYCIHVYLKNLWTEQNGQRHNASSNTPGSMKKGLPSYQSSSNSSQRGNTARAVYQRLKKVLWLQWRGLFIVTIILVDVVYFAVIFVWLDGQQSTIVQDWDEVGPWIVCMVQDPSPKGRNECMPLIQPHLVSEGVLVSVLMLLSIAGMQCFLLLARPSLFSAWWTLITKGPTNASRQPEFIDLDAAAAAANRPGLAGRSMSAQKPLLPSHSQPGQRQSTSALGISSGKMSPQVAVLSIPDNNWPLKSELAPSVRNSLQSVESGISAESQQRSERSHAQTDSQAIATATRMALAATSPSITGKAYSPQLPAPTTSSPHPSLSPHKSQQRQPSEHTFPTLGTHSTAGSTPPLSSLRAFQQSSPNLNVPGSTAGTPTIRPTNSPSLSPSASHALSSSTPASPERNTRSPSPVPPQTLYQRQQLQRHLQQRDEWRMQQQQQQQGYQQER